MKRLFMCVAVMAAVGCTLGKQNAPALTGPSEFALSLQIAATPDLMDQDGQSRSTITVTARDHNSQPVPGVTIKAEIVVGGIYVDFGTLSSRLISTGNDGRATLTYTAPPKPPLGAGTVLVNVLFTPVGTNYANASTRVVEIRLTPPGVILPPNGAPRPSFFFSPTSARAGDDILFDASASDDDGVIVAYSWDYGDGNTGSGVKDTHSYDLSGTYRVTLTVTDDQGIRASTAPITVTVGLSANPVANFSFSPASQISGQNVFFNGSLSTAVDGRRIVSWRWDFGDGAFGNGETIAHIYGKAGSYNVVLVVTDDTGRTGTASRTVSIVPPSLP